MNIEKESDEEREVFERMEKTMQFMSISVDDYMKLSDELALARVLIRELGDRLAKLEKPWVGLTDEDLESLCNEWRIVFGSWTYEFAKAIEAKLKEKNNDVFFNKSTALLSLACACRWN